jgi:hypothetical protein
MQVLLSMLTHVFVIMDGTWPQTEFASTVGLLAQEDVLELVSINV